MQANLPNFYGKLVWLVQFLPCLPIATIMMAASATNMPTTSRTVNIVAHHGKALL